MCIYTHSTVMNISRVYRTDTVSYITDGLIQSVLCRRIDYLRVCRLNQCVRLSVTHDTKARREGVLDRGFACARPPEPCLLVCMGGDLSHILAMGVCVCAFSFTTSLLVILDACISKTNAL